MYAMTLVFTSTAIMSGKPFEGRAEEYDSVLSLSIFCKQDDIGMNSFLFPQSSLLKVFFKEDGNSSINPVRKFWGTTFFCGGGKKNSILLISIPTGPNWLKYLAKTHG